MYATTYDETLYGDGMGLAIPAVAGAISAIGGLFGGNSKDPGRLATNAAAYGDAQAGDASAVTFLKARSGRYGTIPISPPWHGDPASPLGGWATSKAKDDAFAKYNAVSQSVPYVQTTSAGATVALPTAAKPIAAAVGGIPTSTLLVAGAAVLALAFALKK